MAKSKTPNPTRSEAGRRAQARRRRTEWDPLREHLSAPPPAGYWMGQHEDYQLALLGIWAAIEGLQAFAAHYEPQLPAGHTCARPCGDCESRAAVEHARGSVYVLRTLRVALEEASGSNLGPTRSLQDRLEWVGAPRAVELFRLLRRLLLRAEDRARTEAP